MCANWNPLIKQCFVTSGVSLNFMTHGMVLSFTSILLTALKKSKEIEIDDSTSTWIASIFTMSSILAILQTPWSINRFGRKPAHLITALLMASGWLTIALSRNSASLLFGRFIQGYSIGSLAILGSVLIGEYCTPKHRGALLGTIVFCIMTGVLITHTLGTVLSWRRIAMIYSGVSTLNTIMILFSPESPSFLATRGKYNECRRAFRWLRGWGEEEELEKLIRTDMATKRNNLDDRSPPPSTISDRISNVFCNVKAILHKREFCKPILIVLHLYAMNLWSGAVMFSLYTNMIVDTVVGDKGSFNLVILSLDIQLIISSIIGIVTIKKMRRKSVLAVMMTSNVLAYLSIALYVFLKTHSLLKFNHYFIGIALLHVHMFSQSGCLILSNIIPGEVFPLLHRGLCGMIGILFFSINETIYINSSSYLLSTIGLHGAFMVYASIVLYCGIVLLIILPETKNRTLLDIEEEFRGSPLISGDILLTCQEINDISTYSIKEREK